MAPGASLTDGGLRRFENFRIKHTYPNFSLQRQETLAPLAVFKLGHRPLFAIQSMSVSCDNRYGGRTRP